MTRRSDTPKEVRRPVGAGGLSSALMWALAGPLACFALLAGTIWLTWGIPVQNETQLRGVLRPVATPIGVDLPEFAVLDQIVVSQGDVVRKGQSLALLDISDMRQRHDQLLESIAIARIKRHCMTASDNAEFHAAMSLLLQERAKPRGGNSTLAGEQLRASDAAVSVFEETVRDEGMSCTLANAAWDALQTHEAQKLQASEERLDLLSRKIAVLVERQSLANLSAEAKSELAVEALETLLARNALEAAHIDAVALAEASRLERSNRRAEQAQEITDEIAGMLAESAEIASLLEEPRLTAPVTGVITRLRDPGPGHRAISDLRFVELTRAGGQGFRLAITVPPGEVGRLRHGAKVELALAGAVGAPPLGGSLDLERRQVDPDDPPGTVMVNLSADARRWLASDRGTVALGGGATASLVRVSFDDTAFGETIRRASSALAADNQGLALADILKR